MYVIGDIAGEYDALLRLVAKLDSTRKIVLVGDLMDRGPKSKEVIEWAMNRPNTITLLGNHEHMMIDYFENTGIYGGDIWEMNGGGATLKSYDPLEEHNRKTIRSVVPDSHIEWLKNLPLKHEDGDFIITHAPSAHMLQSPEKEEEARKRLTNIWAENLNPVWVRAEPYYFKGKIQVFGHNSHWGLRTIEKNGITYAICIDDSRKKVLTCLDTTNFEIIQEPFNVQGR